MTKKEMACLCRLKASEAAGNWRQRGDEGVVAHIRKISGYKSGSSRCCTFSFYTAELGTTGGERVASGGVGRRQQNRASAKKLAAIKRAGLRDMRSGIAGMHRSAVPRAL